MFFYGFSDYIEVLFRNKSPQIWKVPNNFPDKTNIDFLEKHGLIIGIPKDFEDYVNNFFHLTIERTYRQVGNSDQIVKE